MRHFILFTVLICSTLTSAMAKDAVTITRPGVPPPPVRAIFEVKWHGNKEVFYIALESQPLIKQARAELKKPVESRLHVSGNIAAGNTSYNRPWRFYLKPKTIGFFEAMVEVCDSTASGVQANLQEWLVMDATVGGPGFWCPWNSYIASELAVKH